MTREIKFRGLTGNGNWVYGHYFFDPVHDVHQIVQAGVFYTVKPETIGQYTGLNDETGVEMYEGDIIRALPKSKNKKPLTVDWWNGSWVATSFGVGYTPLSKFTYQSAHSKNQRCVVAGNIHQNAELLAPY